MTTLTMPRPRKDSGMEGVTAKWYAANTAEMMNEYVELAERIASQLAPGSSALEIAPGPGYFSIELARRGSYIVTGIDISRTFVRMAAKKAAETGVKVDFRQGSASNLPIQSDSYDFLLCRAAFKNFGEPVRALQEMCRVLKPGGKGLIIDLKGDIPSGNQPASRWHGIIHVQPDTDQACFQDDVAEEGLHKAAVPADARGD